MFATRAVRATARRSALSSGRATAAFATARRAGPTSLLSTTTTMTAAAASTLSSHSLLLTTHHSHNGSYGSVMLTQRRTQYMPVAGKRDQEAFLTQFDPMDVLGINEECTIEDIDAGFERMKGKYAANGPSPDAKMLDRVFRAHEILKDPDSPYYVRAHSSQTDRQRLQFQLLPKNKRCILEFQVGILLCVLLIAAILLVKMCMQPMTRSLRAATR